MHDGEMMASRGLDIVFSTDHERLVDHIFRQLNRRLDKWPDHRAFLIVPEPMKADIERGYMTKAHAEGLMMAEVLSFRRLAARLFAESGTFTAPPLSGAGKAVLAQSILLDNNIPFRRFHRLAGKPRYASELVSILGDFQRYDISSEDLLRVDMEHRATLDKFYDFALLKNALEGALFERGRGDPDRTLTNLAEMLSSPSLPDRLRFLTKSHVFVLGFGGDRQFTAQELAILRGLASHAPCMTITVSADFPGGSRGILAFQHGRATIDTLCRLFPGIRVSQPGEADGGSAETAAGGDSRAAGDKQAAIHLVRAVNSREEARFCAGQIRELLLTAGLRRKDIGIALCDDQSMTGLIETTLAEYGVDAWIDGRRPLTQSSFLRTFTAFLALSAYDFSLDDLMDYYRAGLSPLQNDVIDAFENAALALGWTSARDFRNLEASPALIERELTDRYHVSGIERNQIHAALDDVFHLLAVTSKMRRVRNGHGKCELLLDFMFEGTPSGEKAHNPAAGTSQRAVHSTLPAGPAFPEPVFSPGSLAERVMARRDLLLSYGRADSVSLLVSSWNAAVDFLTESGELLGKTRLSQEHFTELLLAGLEGLSLSSVPFGVDRVRVGSLQSMAAWPCRVLFILGTKESVFPPEVRQQGYLCDEERDFLSEQLGKPFPNRRKDQPASQAWLVHMLLARPSTALYLSVPSLGEEQSHVFDELRRRAFGTVTVFSEPCCEPDVRWNALPAALRITRWNTEAPPAWKAAAAKLSKTEHRLRAPADEIAEHYTVPENLAREVIICRDGVSASSLQQYNTCPFRFFTAYVARARDREIARDDPGAQGTMLHRLMELAARDLTDRLHRAGTPEETEKMTREWLQESVVNPAYMRELYDLAAAGRGLGWYARPSLSGSIGERLRLYAAKTLQVLTAFGDNGSYSPRFLEWYFPSDSSKPYRLRAGGASFTLRGLIDRVEENQSGDVRLIDYKRSGKDFSWLALRDGTDLQLPLYKRAFEAAFPDRKIKEFYFCGFDSPDSKDFLSYDSDPADKNEAMASLMKQKKRWETGEIEAVARFAEQKAVRTIENMLSGDFSAKPKIRSEKDNPCRYCVWRAACGYDGRLARNAPLPSDRAAVARARDMIICEEGE